MPGFCVSVTFYHFQLRHQTGTWIICSAVVSNRAERRYACSSKRLHSWIFSPHCVTGTSFHTEQCWRERQQDHNPWTFVNPVLDQNNSLQSDITVKSQQCEPGSTLSKASMRLVYTGVGRPAELLQYHVLFSWHSKYSHFTAIPFCCSTRGGQEG